MDLTERKKFEDEITQLEEKERKLQQELEPILQQIGEVQEAHENVLDWLLHRDNTMDETMDQLEELFLLEMEFKDLTK
ncbi:hypothetical protein TVAG_385040 [Trichomonas vaginalis G3]|uniref:PAC domain-containing protein n=1 Tax=Trichomonas vaginalis (strain ATCC PRA-98 / G3) TaxID=412133 RepID=A2G0Q9_TRIV3|nr:hypothetical protein TVAGG3_0118300 [Trichomonas vaginalis G3]EAX89253.1 hypothetical protein TVAG_385040 [Trichomonas vaginalis G3]KAI5545302.1 hypothetical protein TVAGG3_0118300 [Trichomonas vaginalis G3]|eukprot:XP_001302183.1 hypothetical protein [Trichomonas vaginalis G3]